MILGDRADAVAPPRREGFGGGADGPWRGALGAARRLTASPSPGAALLAASIALGAAVLLLVGEGREAGQGTRALLGACLLGAAAGGALLAEASRRAAAGLRRAPDPPPPTRAAAPADAHAVSSLVLDARSHRMRLAMDTLGLALWESDLRGGTVLGTPNLFALYGLPAPPDGRAPRSLFWDTYHPEDRAPAIARFEADLRGEGGGADTYRARVRILRPSDGRLRWLEITGRMFGPPGARAHLLGVARDVTEAQEAEERRALLAREVDHRANNTLAVVQAILRLSRAPDADAYRRQVQARVLSLARSHALLARADWCGAELRAVVENELGAHAGRVALSGPPPWLAPLAVQPVAMLLHELAANAAAHGALAAPGGRVEIACREAEGRFALVWTERGGPAVAGPPARRGAGTAVLEAAARQLGGTVAQDWPAEGMVARLSVPAARIVAAR